MTMKSFFSDPVRSAQVLFFINTALWVYMAAVSLIRPDGDASPDEPIGMGIMAALMFGNAVLMFWSGLMLGTRLKLYFYIAVMLLVINVMLTVTDQTGLLENLTLLVDIVLLGLMGLTRKNYERS